MGKSEGAVEVQEASRQLTAAFRPEHCGRALVIGGQGYLGSFLVQRLLEYGIPVTTFDKQAPAVVREGVRALDGDLRHYDELLEACADADTVFHLAAVINTGGICRLEERLEVFDINVTGTENVVRACRAAGVKRLIYTSSVNVCFDREIQDGDEDEPYASEFLDLYTETKVLAEKAVLGAAETGLRTVALRPGGIWGPGSGGLMVQTMLQELFAGKFNVLIGNGKARVDNTHVENLVNSVLLALVALEERPETVSGRPYFITDGEPMDGMDWFRPAVEGLGYKFPTMRLPAFLMYFVSWVMEWIYYFTGRVPLVTRLGILKLTRSHFFSIKRAGKDLGYRPVVQSVAGLTAALPDYRLLNPAQEATL